MSLLKGLTDLATGGAKPSEGQFDASGLSKEQCLKIIGEKAELDNLQAITSLIHEPNINARFRSKLPTLKAFI